MTPTRAGWGLAFFAALTLAAAASSGNNLLYLVYSAAVASLLLSWGLGRLNLAAIEATAEVPGQVFRGEEFPLTLRLRRLLRLPSFLLRARWGDCERSVERLSSAAETVLRLRAPLRGINRIEGLCLESSFPFGLLLHRRRLPPVEAIAFPRLREIRSPKDVSSIAEAGGELALRKGSGEEFFGVREYSSSDDTRWINWKLSAKQGRPLVTEFAEPVGSKVTVRLRSLEPGTETERLIEEAASASRYFIDAGAEVRLVTPEAEEPYGKGLLHLERMFRALALAGEGKLPRAAPASATAPRAAAVDAAFLRRLTWLGAAIVFVSMFLIDEISPVFLAALSPILPLSLWLQERDGPWLPNRLWNALSLAALAFVTLADWRLSGIILTNTHLVLYLMANRLLNPIRGDSPRQSFMILFLAFFLVSGQTISLWYFPAFLLFTAFVAIRLAAGAGARPGHWRLWGPSLASAWALSLGLTALVFAATPRFDAWYQSNPFASALGLDKLRAQSGAVSGFTEDVSLGFFGRLKLSASRVMRVKPFGPVRGTPPPVYIRGSAFDAFDGKRWRKTPAEFRYRLGSRLYPSMKGRAWMPRRENGILIPAPPSAARTLDLEFTIYPMNTPVVFTVARALAIEGVNDTVGFDANDGLSFNAPHITGIRYRVIGTESLSGYGDLIEDYPRFLGTRYLQVPDAVGPRVRDLARKITASAQGDKAKLRAIDAYLRGNFRYSLISKNPDAGIEDFLFSTKSGNCEYFATAEALLLRLAGVPSRLVAGFLAQDWNEFGLFYDVRQSQAHAWVEVYLNGQWVLSDPTPPGSFSLGDNVLDRFSRWFTAAQARWYQHVIGYDTYVQRNTFYRMGLNTVRGVLEKATRAALYLGAATCIALALWGSGLWILGRLRPPREPYLRAQAALERAGIKRAPSQTPKEFAQEVARTRPALGAIGELAEWHYAERYGGRRLTANESSRAEDLLREMMARL